MKRLLKREELEDLDLKQQINVIGRLDEGNGRTMFFTIKKLEETTFEFSQNAITVA